MLIRRKLATTIVFVMLYFLNQVVVCVCYIFLENLYIPIKFKIFSLTKKDQLSLQTVHAHLFPFRILTLDLFCRLRIK